MKASTAILLGLLGVGAYLLYRSFLNLQSSLGVIGTDVNGAISTAEAAYNTVEAEYTAGKNAILNPLGTLSQLGTSAYNGVSSFFGGSGSSSSTLSSDLGTNSLFMADGTPIGNLGDNTLTASGDPLNQGLIPVDGGTLNLHLGGGLSGTDSNGNYPSLTDSSPGDGFSGDDGTDGLLDELNFFSGD